MNRILNTTVMCSLKADNRSPDFKTFFMFNSAVHGIFSYNKYENANNSLLKLTIVGIFIFISTDIFMLSYV